MPDHPTPSAAPDLLLQHVLGGACERACLGNAQPAAGSSTFGKCSFWTNVYVVESSESTFQIISVYKVFLTPLGVPSPVRGGGGPREEKQFIAGGAEHPLVSENWSPPGQRGHGRRGSRRSLREPSGSPADHSVPPRSSHREGRTELDLPEGEEEAPQGKSRGLPSFNRGSWSPEKE